MKLKLFEDILDYTGNYENKQRIGDDIKSIFLELTDDGYEVFLVRLMLLEDETSCRVRIENDKEYLYSDVRDRVDMFIDYMKDIWDDVKIEYSYVNFYETTAFFDNGQETVEYTTKSPDDSSLINYLKIFVKKSKPKLNMIKRFIKKFEAFSMNKSECDRCGGPTDGITTMSMFNEDIICMDCKDSEKDDPDYEHAANIERVQIRRGNTNFKGAFPNYKPLK